MSDNSKSFLTHNPSYVKLFMYSLGHVAYDRYLNWRIFYGLTGYSVRHDQEGNGMKGKGKWNWTKSLLFVLMAAVMMLGVQTVRAYAQTPASKPGNVKISNPNGDDTALISWENPWGDTELAAKNDKDVTGGLVIEQSTDGGKNWEYNGRLILGGMPHEIEDKLYNIKNFIS